MNAGWRVFVVGSLALSACTLDTSPLPDLVDDRGVYAQDELGITKLELVVSDLDGLYAVEHDEPGARVDAVFRAPDYEPDSLIPNATLELRGRSSRTAILHSYKVRLTNDPWRGMVTLNLQKHPFDLTRLRNRLALEHMRDIPHMVSLRTQFVHLYMNREDLGLYEIVENPGKRFLEAHGLPSGELFKANSFAFYPLTAAQRSDPAQLEKVIESKADDLGLDELDSMLTEVNDPLIDTRDIFESRFNLDNYTAWLATNVLMGHFDTVAKDFMLYRPAGETGWYFLPWNYDTAFGFNGPDGQPGSWDRPSARQGLGSWWMSPLHRRFIRDPELFASFEATLQAMANGALSDARSRQLLASYHDLVQPVIGAAPDVDSLPNNFAPIPVEMRQAAWETEYVRLGEFFGRAYDEYRMMRDRPMPVFMADPEVSADKIVYRWEDSYSIPQDPLVYEIAVSTTPTFAQTVLQENNLVEPTFVGPRLPSGTYYWRVVIHDTVSGAIQESGEEYIENNTLYPGVRVLVIP